MENIKINSINSMIVTKNGVSYGSIISKTKRIKNSSGLLNWVKTYEITQKLNNLVKHINIKNNMLIKDFVEYMDILIEQSKTTNEEISYHIQDFNEPLEVYFSGFNYRSSSNAKNSEVITLAPVNRNFGSVEISYDFLFEDILENVEISNKIITSKKFYFLNNEFKTKDFYLDYIKKYKLTSKKSTNKISKTNVKVGSKVDVLFDKIIDDVKEYDYYYLGEYNNLLCINRILPSESSLKNSGVENTDDIIKTKRYILKLIHKESKEESYKILTKFPHIKKQYKKCLSVVPNNIDIYDYVIENKVRFKNINSGKFWNQSNNTVNRFFSRLILSKNDSINYNYDISETNDITDLKQFKYDSDFMKNNDVYVYSNGKVYSFWENNKEINPKEFELTEQYIKEVVKQNLSIYSTTNEKVFKYKEYKIMFEINDIKYNPYYILSGCDK